MKILVREDLNYIFKSQEKLKRNEYFFDSIWEAYDYLDRISWDMITFPHVYNEIWSFHAKIYWWDYAVKGEIISTDACTDLYVLITDWYNYYSPRLFEDNDN